MCLSRANLIPLQEPYFETYRWIVGYFKSLVGLINFNQVGIHLHKSDYVHSSKRPLSNEAYFS